MQGYVKIQGMAQGFFIMSWREGYHYISYSRSYSRSYDSMTASCNVVLYSYCHSYNSIRNPANPMVDLREEPKGQPKDLPWHPESGGRGNTISVIASDNVMCGKNGKLPSGWPWGEPLGKALIFTLRSSLRQFKREPPPPSHPTTLKNLLAISTFWQDTVWLWLYV